MTAICESIYLGIGSNIDRERYILAGIDALSHCFGSLMLSSVYESEAYGFKGDPFYNLVVRCRSGLSIERLISQLKHIELRVAGSAGGAKYRPRKLDIDLLLYGRMIGNYGTSKVPRADILRHEYVLRPLAEIAPRERHPLVNQTYADLLLKRFPAMGVSYVDFNWCEQAMLA